MDLRNPGILVFVYLAVSQAILAQAPHVTETKLVNAEAGKGQELLRRINGRWWSQDNREVNPPPPGGFFWVLDSKPGVCQFFHHRPFQLERAESLHLWMRKDEVEAVLGQPNRTFGRDDHAFWWYYAANGVKLEVRFMADGVLGEAKYSAAGEKSWPVASVESETGGQDIYKLLQARANNRLAANQAVRTDAFRRNTRSAGSRMQPSVVTVDAVNPQAEPPAKKRIISAEALAAIKPGATREDLLRRLGEPGSRFSISGDDGIRESFTYDLDNGESTVIHLVDGKVVSP